ncbi:MAG: PD-(D/E)XK nuclease family protein, partial [Flavobacteriales bacterium]|nr:PD-(D/E)XK nuclease family protein [Flavobacteriales bacterium]
TLGTVVHRSLEDLYKPFVNQLLTEQDLRGMLPKIPAKLKELFSEEFKKGTFDKGKNLLVYTVAEQFLNSFIKLELKFLKNNELHIIGLEQDLKAEITIDSLDFSINLNGNADRIDQCNGGLRITDYKTGMVNKNELQTDDLELLVWDKSYQKGFQLYLYAYLYHKMNPDQKKLETGIVSFRALKNGFIPAGFKEGKQLTTLLDSNLLTDFEAEFKSLLASIFDTTIPFHHKDRTEPCRFCDPQEFR